MADASASAASEKLAQTLLILVLVGAVAFIGAVFVFVL
jgi:hypothetical protein